MKKKSNLVEVEIPKQKETYFLFSKYPHGGDYHWRYFGEYDTREECENDMEQSGEPESIEYKIIRGIELEYEEGIPRFPYVIKGDI
jgi:hypothetical protein